MDPKLRKIGIVHKLASKTYVKLYIHMNMYACVCIYTNINAHIASMLIT